LNTFLRWHFYCRILTLLLAVFSAAGVCLPETATGRSKPLSKYLREEWGSEKGFPGGTINVITQTLDGYLWLGTQAGLVRFDGVRFTSFGVINRGALNHVWVRNLLEDEQHNLWIGTNNAGLIRLENGTLVDPTGTLRNPPGPQRSGG